MQDMEPILDVCVEPLQKAAQEAKAYHSLFDVIMALQGLFN